MRNSKHYRTLIASLLALAGGFFVVGPLDAFHSHTGVQFYLSPRWNYDFLASATGYNWPWFIPLQMGIAGIFLLFNIDMHLLLLEKWFPQLRPKIVDKSAHLKGPAIGQSPVFIYIVATLMVISGYLLAWAVDDLPFRLTYYLMIYIATLLYLTLVHGRVQILVFILAGVWGTGFETILLDPAIGYFRYDHPDFWGRSPGWLLFVYGWVGLFVNELRSWMRVKINKIP